MLIRKVKGIILVFSISAVFAILAFHSGNHFKTSQTNAKTPSYILDAGHGNPDGGAVGCDQSTTEASLNLTIAKNISEQLKNSGVHHLMIRDGEESIYSEGETIHEKKVSDVRNRIKIASYSPNTPLISIHMNSYPDPSVYGIQVFYGNKEEAKALAQKLQTVLNDRFQPDHAKVAKEVSKNVYFFSHIDNPVILIECGFLSNEEELNLLKSDKYRNNLSKTIAEVLISQS